MKRVNFLCLWVGHKYSFEKRLNSRTLKLKCLRCNKYFAMHFPTQSLIEWDEELEEFYKPGGLLEVL